jgi:hypothetical protein
VALGLVVVERADLPCSGFSRPGWHKILVQSSPTAARVAFSIAHEIGELHVHKELPAELHERLCDRIAAGLLMPITTFRADLRDLNFDLIAVWKKWPNASLEAVASRIADVHDGALATSWKNVIPKWSKGATEDRHLVELEQEALAEVYCRAKEITSVERSGMVSRAYRMRSRDVRRAITISRPAV